MFIVLITSTVINLILTLHINHLYNLRKYNCATLLYFVVINVLRMFVYLLCRYLYLPFSRDYTPWTKLIIICFKTNEIHMFIVYICILLLWSELGRRRQSRVQSYESPEGSFEIRDSLSEIRDSKFNILINQWEER
jgi:hypothetical protein